MLKTCYYHFLQDLIPTYADIPQGNIVGETKLGLEAGQNFLFDLLHCITVEDDDLQRLTHLPVSAHSKQHFELL